MAELNELLADRHIRIRLNDAAADRLIELGFDSKMGARPLAKTINELVKVPISKKILFENIAAHSVINVGCQNKELTFDIVSYNMLPVLCDNSAKVDEHGYITVV